MLGNKGGLKIIIGVLVVLGLAVWYTIGKYNAMVALDETVITAWSQVENVYQRRIDLIPNFVESVKGYAAHEENTLTAVVEARAKATSTTVDINDAASLQAFNAVQGELSSALSKLLVVVESYPDLKANQNFMLLQTELESTENRIAVERKKFNETVMEYNIYIRTFPTNLVANAFNFEQANQFEAIEGADVAPVVNFDK